MKNLVVLPLLILVFSANTYAYTECPSSLISKIHTGDNGNVYIYYVNGGSTRINEGDINLQNALSLALAAFMGDKKVKVRYTADDVTCNAGLINDFRGLWLTSD